MKIRIEHDTKYCPNCIMYFDKNEYTIFKEYVDSFNQKARKIIGYDAVITPTQSAITNFKKKTGQFLQEYNYREKLKSII